MVLKGTWNTKSSLSSSLNCVGSRKTGQWSDRSTVSDRNTTRSNELLARLGIEDLDLILKERRLCWYGHVECSNGAVKTVFHVQVEGKCGHWRPKMTWKQLTERDCREWKLSAINPHDRHTWCEICHACSKPAIWKGAHWCVCCPCTCMLIKNLIMMIMRYMQAW